MSTRTSSPPRRPADDRLWLLNWFRVSIDSVSVRAKRGRGELAAPQPRTLRSTNAIESMISICRDRSSNVKNWQNGQMALRWCAAGMIEASKQFRRVNGHLHLPALRDALQRHAATTTVPADCYKDHVA